MGVKNTSFAPFSSNLSKTNPKFFETIVEQLQQKYPELLPQAITFFDDSQSKVDTACSVGINGQLYEGIQQVEALFVDK